VLVEIIGREFDVPTVEAVPAPVRDDVARFETFVGGVAEEPALAAAVDADDGFWDGHGVTVPRSRHTGACALLPVPPVVVVLWCPTAITLVPPGIG
jgi:hypothetical protein